MNTSGPAVHNAGMNRLRSALRLCALGLVLALAACATPRGARSPLDQALYDYAGAVRWSEFEVAQTFLSPELQRTRALSDLEIERFKQVQVTDYQFKRAVSQDETRYVQLVEIRLINKHTQVERVLLDRQEWEKDPESERWWLVSGLPRFADDRDQP